MSLLKDSGTSQILDRRDSFGSLFGYICVAPDAPVSVALVVQVPEHSPQNCGLVRQMIYLWFSRTLHKPELTYDRPGSPNGPCSDQ